jgi:hypothetical protein
MIANLVQLWDGRQVPGQQRGDLHVFGFRHAPAGLATRRQLRAMGKRPGGQDITAVIEWRRGRRWAGLYRIDQAATVRPMTPARRAALDRAMSARRTCRTCGLDAGYCLPTSVRQCWPCYQADPTTTSDQPGGPSAKNTRRAGSPTAHQSSQETSIMSTQRPAGKAAA